MVKRRKEASSSIGYVFLFLTVMLLVIITMYMMQVAKLMTHQHHVDDALSGSVLGSLMRLLEIPLSGLRMWMNPFTFFRIVCMRQ